MTQSGQGEEPSARSAREGIVLPSDGGEPLLPGSAGGPGPQQPRHAAAPPADGGPSWGGAPAPDRSRPAPPEQPWAQQQPAVPGPLPPEGAPAAPSYHAPEGAYGTNGTYGGAGGYGGHGPQPAAGAPLPPAADEAATQYLPPVAAPQPDEAATQYLPPVPGGPGALPPEAPDETTRVLGRARHGGAGQGGPGQGGAGQGGPGQGGAGQGGPDAEATQYLPPVAAQAAGPAPYGAGDGRATPAEFDNLFRNEGAASTQPLPRVQPGPPSAAPAAGPAPYAPQQPAGGRGRGRGGRTGSRVPLIAAIGVGIVVLGVGAGALLGGGNGGEDDHKTPVSATAPASSASSSPSADPARQQAVALDELLADSGSSRASVISAVADIKRCANLGQAASDLRAAARQRAGLVTRLSKLSVDRLPQHDELTAALTRAWQASASADNHYAAWADETGGKKGCKKGQARITRQAQAGNRASGVASAEKAKAARLWNTIAQQYGLTQRQPTQL
ncbi:hypothetical protein ACFOOM_14055 [Streptomyces echinoruber]|uniref:Uncharacterized protein n=1 Tax=Streptomyces echinoruber TaxID=68898 RepID=A0A918VFX7_9ACTN|nr:hypothetical protein [Streptomyces echinoruber]GGZ94919.1 hypothetical protein GCM10010389_37250 [Streptomyces echinoruber]